MSKKKKNVFADGMDFNMKGMDELLDFRNVGLSLGKGYDMGTPKPTNRFVKKRYAALKSGEAPLDQQEEYNFQRNQNIRGEEYY
jgi:hypothetical protein